MTPIIFFNVDETNPGKRINEIAGKISNSFPITSSFPPVIEIINRQQAAITIANTLPFVILPP